jgi:hypothetical protein
MRPWKKHQAGGMVWWRGGGFYGGGGVATGKAKMRRRVRQHCRSASYEGSLHHHLTSRASRHADLGEGGRQRSKGGSNSLLYASYFSAPLERANPARRELCCSSAMQGALRRCGEGKSNREGAPRPQTHEHGTGEWRCHCRAPYRGSQGCLSSRLSCGGWAEATTWCREH